MKVLIIDDDRECVHALSKLIAAVWKIDEVALEIVGVGTLAEGLRESQDANVTILDLNLPDSSADETIARIPEFTPPVIVITGSVSSEASAAKCMKAGATHVFIKGSLMGFIPSFFRTLQQDLVRRAHERHEAAA